MPRVSDAFLAELGLQRADYPVHQPSDDPAKKLRRACLTHEVMMPMLESAEAPAPFLKLDTAVVFAMLRDLVIEEAERSPFGLVERDPEHEPSNNSERSIGEILAEAPRLTEVRHELPRAPEWARPLDRGDDPDGSRR